jgi:hypothetical protein
MRDIRVSSMNEEIGRLRASEGNGIQYKNQQNKKKE